MRSKRCAVQNQGITLRLLEGLLSVGLLIAEGMHSGFFCNYQGRLPHLLVKGHIFLHFVFGSIPPMCVLHPTIPQTREYSHS